MVSGREDRSPHFVAAHVKRRETSAAAARFGWFVLLWLLGVLSLTVLALPIRWLLRSI